MHRGRGSTPGWAYTFHRFLHTYSVDCVSCVWVTHTYRSRRAPHVPQSRHPPFLRRFLLQLVGILLEDIVTKQLRVDMSEQQHTFYCQELGTLLMCLIHIFKSGGCPACLRKCVPSRPHLVQAVLPHPRLRERASPTTRGAGPQGKPGRPGEAC